MHEAAVEDIDCGDRWLQTDGGGGLQGVISSFEPQPESQMMHL